MTRTRKSYFMLVVTVLGAAGMFTNCESSSAKATKSLEKEAKEDELLAKQEQIQGQRDSIADYQKFKAEAEEQIARNSHTIADYKVRIMTGRVAMKAQYQNRLSKLEKQNNDMRNRLEQYSKTGIAKREMFKRDWSLDMDRLVKSLKEMTENNK